MRNILVVDDYSTNAILVKNALPEKKYSVKTASSGEQALNSLKNRRADLILLDTVMPEMDGIETLRRIKSNPDTQDIPVILLTGQTDKNMIIEGLSLGAIDVIVKPIVAKVVKERVTRAFKGASPGQLAEKLKTEEDIFKEVQLEENKTEVEEIKNSEYKEVEYYSVEDDLDEGIW